MSLDFPEADWRTFRKLRQLALDRFCQSVLAEVQAAAADESQSAHDRYLTIYRLLEKRDRELAAAFDAPRRSQAFFQLAVIHARGLLLPEELAQFSPATQERLARR